MISNNKWSHTDHSTAIFLLLTAGNNNKYKTFKQTVKQLKWHFYDRSYY